MRNFLLGLRWVNPLLDATFEVGKYKPLILILRQEDTDLNFNSDLQAGKPTSNLLLSVPIRTQRKEAATLCLPALTLLASPFLHCHESLFLWNHSDP